MLTLRQARMSRLLTVRELAERAGVATSTVHLTETGKTTPRVSVMRKLARVLDMPASEITEFAAAMGLPVAAPGSEAGSP